MKIYNKYIIKIQAKIFFITLLLLSIIITITQLFQVMDWLLYKNFHLSMVLNTIKIIFMLSLGISIPIVCMISVIIFCNIIYTNQSLFIIRSFGISGIRFVSPVILSFMFIMIISYAIMIFVIPKYYTKLYQYENLVQTLTFSALKNNNMMNTDMKGKIIAIDRVSNEENKLYNIFLLSDSENFLHINIIKEGKIEHLQNKLFFDFRKLNRYVLDNKTFYQLSLDRLDSKTILDRFFQKKESVLKTKELSLQQLFSFYNDPFPPWRKRVRKELYRRLTWSSLCFIAPLFILSIMLKMPFRRQGIAYINFLIAGIGISIFVIYSLILSLAKSYEILYFILCAKLIFMIFASLILIFYKRKMPI